jgi:predicted nuclease of predicted toxin-antitoxin system
VKLLFDENLSPSLVSELGSEFRGSAHVREAGLRGGADYRVWEYARAHGYAIVSKDTDFRERSFLEGAPPKIIWLDVGNAGTAAIAALLRSERARIERFETQPETSVLILSIGAKAI